MLDVEQWAELRRREHFVGAYVWRATRSNQRRDLMRCRGFVVLSVRRSRSVEDEIHEPLRGDPALTRVMVRELIEPLAFDGGKNPGAPAD